MREINIVINITTPVPPHTHHPCILFYDTSGILFLSILSLLQKINCWKNRIEEGITQHNLIHPQPLSLSLSLFDER